MHVDTNSHKLKNDENVWVGMIKNCCDQSGHGTLKLTPSQEKIDEVKGKLTIVSLIFEWVWSKIGVAIHLVYKILKSAVS